MEKLPPQALDIESDLLGTFLLDMKAIDNADILREEMFYDPINQIIFRAIKILHNEYKPIDYNTVEEQLRTMGKLDDIGGAYKLMEITSKVSSSAHTEYYSAIIFDKWYARELIRICSNIVQGAYTGLDIDTLRANLDREIIKLDEFENTNSVSLIELLHEVKSNLKERQENKEKGIKTCIETPFNQLNYMMNGGFHNGDLVILAARPGMGKTKFASEFAEYFAKNAPGAFLSLEMTTEQLILRMFVKNGAEMRNMMTGEMKEQDWIAVDEKSGELSTYHNITFKDDLYELYKIGSFLRKLKKEKQLEWAVIDYLGLIEMSEKSETRNIEIGKMTRYFKKIAKELKIPIILLAQLNRNDVGKRPQLHDLRDSGNIEQDANSVLFIHRPSVYNQQAVDEDGISWNNRGELIIAKNRQGMIGSVVFQHDDKFSIITEWKQENQDPFSSERVESWQWTNI